MSEKTIQARKTFSEGFNCAQAVLSTFAIENGLDPKDALRVAGAFGGGMGRTGKVCGAVTGAFMAIGLAFSKTRQSDDALRDRGYALVQTFLKRFEERHGSIDCCALIEVDLNTKEGMAEAIEKGLFVSRCAVFVEDAVRLLEELLPD